MRWMICGLAAVLACWGCGKKSKPVESAAVAEQEDVPAAEQPFLEAARPFAEAVAAREYERACQLLSRHARVRMSLNQFKPEEDDAAYKRNEDAPVTNVSAAQFAELMRQVEAQHGRPKGVRELHVFSTDAAVLNRQSKAEFGQLDSMFAIGAMPDSVPADIRRASVRGQILTELTADQLAAVAKESNTTVEDLQRDPDFAPYFNFKVVLVEEAGGLKVGYFEFLPASLLD